MPAPTASSRAGGDDGQAATTEQRHIVQGIGPKRLLADRAYERLREAILSNRLPPGARLSVPELARQMETSRSPVREAVQRLILQGLASHVSYRGAEVAQVDVADLRELYDVREVLEGLAARLAAPRLRESDLARLSALLAKHEEVLQLGEGEAPQVHLDVGFHRIVVDRSGNEYLRTSLGTIHGKAHLAMHALWAKAEDARLSLDEHRRLLQALATRDPDGAERAARAHVASVRARLDHALTRSSPPGQATVDELLG